MKNRKKTTISILIISLFILLLLGGTYAWLKVRIESDVEHVIHAGKLDLILDDETSDGINMENAVPISDKKGKEQDGYQFQLINRGNANSKYTVYLDDLDLNAGEVRMQDSAVKYSLERDGVELSSGLLPEIGSNPNRILDTGTIHSHTTYTYILKVWMDIDATSENMDTIFYAKIRVETEQENIPVTKSEMELTKESKEKVPLKDGEDPKKYTYTSSDWKVVKVDEEGNIEVIGPGYAVITKTDQYGGKEEITVHVTVPVEATFETNDKIASIGTITNNTCNLTENNQTTCQISLPTVEVVDGYEFVGWSNEKDSHEGKKENMDISPDKKILYPIVKIPGKTLTATFIVQGEGVESIESESESCKIEDTYNNDTLKTSCQITLPNMTVKKGYEAIGWNTNPKATEGITPNIININQDANFYTIYKKKAYVLTTTFMLNGAKSLNGLTTSQLESGSKLKLTCTVSETYNGTTANDSCSINVPTIEASDATPNVIGFNENINATIEQIVPGTTITVTENKTYYAITKSEIKTLTATFYKNGASKIDNNGNESLEKKCNIAITYNGQPQLKSCRVTVPSIEASENTPTILGFSTASDLHEKDTNYLNPESKIALAEDVSYYAQTANKNEISYNATYKKGSHVVSIEKETDACTIPPTYNGVGRATSCTVKAPDYTVDDEYKKVGYSEEKDVKEGTTNLTLTKDTIFYANATATSITIEYYSNGEKVGTSTAKVGEDITLTSLNDLNITKAGYHFKGWDINSSATNVVYTDGVIIDDLAEGEIRKIYAVWVDDIAPVCTLTLPEGTYKRDKSLTATLTCTDEGSGLVNPGEKTFTFESSHRNNYGTQVGTTWEPYNDLVEETQSCNYQDGVLTCSIGLLTYSTSTEATLKLLQGMVSDNNGNQNEETQSNAIEIDGDTYTATISKEGVTGITELKTTKTSCTTTGRQQNCYAYADSRSAYEVKTGYLSAMGFSTVPNDDVSNGQDSHKINEDITLYPVTAFVFVAAYTYDETKDASDYCVTGEEETCVETNCYFDKTADACPMGTIIKYYATNATISRYFHVLYDKGTTMLLQERSNTIISSQFTASSESPKDVGPKLALEVLEKNTENWVHVNTQTYTMGTTPFGKENNPYTTCDFNASTSNIMKCVNNSYTLEEKSTKARMLTIQEALDMGCGYKSGSVDCPIWMYNYLNNSIQYGGTQDVATFGYWLMNTPGFTSQSWRNGGTAIYDGRIGFGTAYTGRGIRAVVDITKYDR